MGLRVEWSGLVVNGGQIGDVEQEGEEELRKKREKKRKAMGQCDLGSPWLGWVA